MEFKFSKDSDDSQQQGASGEKKKQSALLVLLLILVGGFAYVYFFTGLIKPQEAQKPADAPAAAPQAEKTPLPARDGEAAKPAGKTPEKGDLPKAAVPPPESTAAPAAKPAPEKPAAPPAVAAAPPAAVKQKEEPAASQSGERQPLPPRAGDKKSGETAAVKAAAKKPAPEAVKPAPEAKKPAAADKKSAPAADKKSTPAAASAKKPAPAVQAKQETGTKAKKAAPDSWNVVIGNYVLGEALSADMGRVRKAGFEPVVKKSERKKTAMNRLFVAEFDDRATALSTLEKLKRLTSDAFVIDQKGKFAVYAGSYLQSGSADSEKERLKAAGVTTTLTQADIAIPSQRLSVGPFKNKKDADAALAKLKGAGIKASISQ